MSLKRFAQIALFSLCIASFALAGCAPPATQAPAPVVTEAPKPVVTEAPAPAVTEPPASKPTEPPAPVVTEEPAPAAKKVARFIWTQEFDTLNPLYSNMWFVSVLYPIYNCQAWFFDDEMEPFPNLVTEIPSLANGGLSEDGRTITLKLRDDLKWSDGEPLTSKDFIFTYEMIMADSNAVASRAPFDETESVTAPDDHTVVVVFNEPYAPWLSLLYAGMSGGGVLPEHILRPVFDTEGTIDNAEWGKAPKVGCGPFVFQEWESGSFARFVRNENFWGKPPILDELFFRFVPDDASQVAALKAGDGDVGTFFAMSDMPELEAAGIKIMKSLSGYNEGWYINQHPEKGHPALKDVRVRQALAYGFNREKLVKDLLLGRAEVPATDWDSTPWEDPDIKPYPYDPEKAKALLDEAGWVDSNGDGVREKDGVDLVLKYGTTTREIRQDTQAVAQQELAQIGIKVELLSYDPDIFFATYLENGASANFSLDIIHYSDSPDTPDPNAAVWRCAEIPSDENPAGLNVTGLCNEEFEALWAQQAIQVDFSARQETFHKITRMILEQAYWIGMWQDPDYFGFSSRMLNVKMSGATPFFNITEWDIAP